MPRSRSRRKADPKRAIGYIRVSTEDQHLGPEAQREALERWCCTEGVELVEVFHDLGVSGGAPLEKRPALNLALDAITRLDAGVLLVMKRDRLARDVMVAAMVDRLVERTGSRLLSCDGDNQDGPEGFLIRGIKDLFAQYELYIIRARTRAALAVKRGKGERIGEVPYGCRLSQDALHLEPHPEEQKTVQYIRRLRARGLPIRTIAARLNRTDHRPRGGRWHKTTVARILGREDTSRPGP